MERFLDTSDPWRRHSINAARTAEEEASRPTPHGEVENVSRSLQNLIEAVKRSETRTQRGIGCGVQHVGDAVKPWQACGVQNISRHKAEPRSRT
jgi:hypothetical protein